MKLSSKTHYGLKACYTMALNYGLEPTSATELGKAAGVSSKYTEQILRLLIKRGIVSGSRGASGGYALTREPKKITVGEIVRTLEDDMKIIDCVTREGTCKCCPTSSVWKKLYTGINKLLDEITLQDLLDGSV